MKTENAVLTVILVLIVLFAIGGLFGCGMMGYGMMGYFRPTSFGFMWIFMSIIWILVIIVLILGILWLAKQLQNPTIQQNNLRKNVKRR